MNSNYIALFLIKYGEYLFDKPIVANITLYENLVNFFCSLSQDSELSILDKMCYKENGQYSFRFYDLISGYNLLKFKYKFKEYCDVDVYFLMVNEDTKERFLKSFTEQEIEEMEKLSWTFYNYNLEYIREELNGKQFVIGPYDYVNSSFVSYLS